MKIAFAIAAACAATLPLCSTAAWSSNAAETQVAFTSVSSGCPGNVAGAVMAVKLELPSASASDAAPRPVNRFRYNFNADAKPSRPVIVGEIRDFGSPGCTVSFAGKGISYD